MVREKRRLRQSRKIGGARPPALPEPSEPAVSEAGGSVRSRLGSAQAGGSNAPVSTASLVTRESLGIMHAS